MFKGFKFLFISDFINLSFKNLCCKMDHTNYILKQISVYLYQK